MVYQPQVPGPICEFSYWGPLPSSFSNLTQISELPHYNNYLSGMISPHVINKWTKLTSLCMKNNTFFGNISPEIGLLTNLTKLYLYDNDLTRPIPERSGT